MTTIYAVECPCCHYEELMRPCRHAVAAINMASTLVELPQDQDVMDHRWLRTVWHLQTWRAPHTGAIKRVSFSGHAEQLKQENLIPPRTHARQGRKRNKPCQPSQSMPRTCPACGMTHVVHLFQAKRQKTIEAANELEIDLTNDSD